MKSFHIKQCIITTHIDVNRCRVCIRYHLNRKRKKILTGLKLTAMFLFRKHSLCAAPCFQRPRTRVSYWLLALPVVKLKTFDWPVRKQVLLKSRIFLTHTRRTCVCSGLCDLYFMPDIKKSLFNMLYTIPQFFKIYELSFLVNNGTNVNRRAFYAHFHDLDYLPKCAVCNQSTLQI